MILDSKSEHVQIFGLSVIPLGVFMSERQHIYEDLNESSSADQEEVSSWRFRRAQIVSRRQTFPPIFLLGAEMLTPAKSLSYDYIFYQAPTFCIPPKILGIANIFMRRQDFRHPPIFS